VPPPLLPRRLLLVRVHAQGCGTGRRPPRAPAAASTHAAHTRPDTAAPPPAAQCVGQGNQRVFLVFLAAALVAQLLFTSQAFALIAANAAAAAPHAAGLAGLLRRVYLASVLHPGLLLLALAQVPLGASLAFLLARGLLGAAANLTVNEFVNRERYLHLKHETAGFCNRWAGARAAGGSRVEAGR
jgi:hypothetical protein